MKKGEVCLQKLKSILSTFTYVTTGVLFCSAFFIQIFGDGITLSVDILWQILSISFLCSLGNLLYFSKGSDRKGGLEKKQLLVRAIIHYFYINIIVIGSGLFFEWFYWYRVDMMVTMFFMILIIYLAIWVINYKKDKMLADRINEKLKEQYKGEEI